MALTTGETDCNVIQNIPLLTVHHRFVPLEMSLLYICLMYDILYVCLMYDIYVCLMCDILYVCLMCDIICMPNV